MLRIRKISITQHSAYLLWETTASFTLQAGATRLRFQEAQQDVLYHIAFTIPRITFSEAKSWLRKRVSLPRKKSEDEFFFATINARSLYFCDAPNNILELIYGQLVVVKIGRPWQPAETLLAAVAPMQLTMTCLILP